MSNTVSKGGNSPLNPSEGKKGRGIDYKWIALSNVLIASMMGTINGSITLISLPAIFNGIHIDPLTSFQYLLWILMGYGLVTATLLLSFGRLSDMYGRVRLFKLGFLVFTIGSILLYLTPSTGDAGAMEIIIFRIVQAVGSALTMANSSAILTDAFPVSERGKALGINMVALMSGQFIGLLLGGILAVFDWRYIFLVSVPFGILGTVWSTLKLKELSLRAPKTKLDIWGNVTFVSGITLLLLGVTYGLMPYGSDAMGWNNPWVIASMVVGFLLLVLFPVVESKVENPMFRLDLFRIKMFTYANVAGFLSALSRGGMMFMLILLLQGIWLPLHGYSYESTPFWAGVYMLPLTIGVIIMGPISGILSDKYGPRWIATIGMVMNTIGFIILASLPANFNYWELGLTLFFMGLGSGMFGSPNSASIMNSVPPQERGVASGMLTTIMNTAFTASMAIFFTIVIVGITQRFPDAMASSLAGIGAAQLTPILSNIPPTGALFSAFLGYNPVETILSSVPSAVVSQIPPATLTTLTGTTWFPSTLSEAFMPSLQISFYIGAVFCGLSALLSALRGKKYIHEMEVIKISPDDDG
ncbi:MFS transporter [Methanobacterium formicicum]|uniref:Major facilitator superfamily protein n=1 Tax=Methanobacterium formicicum (strain DSM 3637 / PP1) TaxID=1204725 RepID=K2REE8_METFP|nr:MFS transporter [Methanobacterium formicicum]EKF86744.1 major facilitator superfamily protein [Methanobacterium formicicum DSM 3637]